MQIAPAGVVSPEGKLSPTLLGDASVCLQANDTAGGRNDMAARLYAPWQHHPAPSPSCMPATTQQRAFHDSAHRK